MMNSFPFDHSWGVAPWWMIGIGGLGIVLALAFVVAVIALKGYSLWCAAKRDEKWWFIILLIINTAGILELIYLFFVVKKWRNITPSSDSSAPSPNSSSSNTFTGTSTNTGIN